MNSTSPSGTIDKQGFYDSLPPHNVSPLWEVMRNLVRPELKSKAVPFQWKYKDIRPLLLKAGEIVTTEEAERRVLVLENPTYRGQSRTTTTLYAGLQTILPGEVAPAHRHSPSALRFVLEGEGAFTAVGGERTAMRRGDLIITPAWAWHDHGNDGTGPCIWLDGLDIPIVGFFEQSVIEEHNDKSQILTKPEGSSSARFGEGLVPIGAESPYKMTSPIFNYPYERTHAALMKLAAGDDPDPYTAHTLRYNNPLDGGWAMPTLSTWMTHVPKGFKTKEVRSADGMVMVVVEGAGSLNVDDTSFNFQPGDVHAIPAWAWKSFQATQDSFLFFFSDRVVLEKLGLYRDERR